LQSSIPSLPRWLIAAALGTFLLSAIAFSGHGNAFAQNGTETPAATVTPTDETVTTADTAFSVGDTLVVVDGPLNLRKAAGTDADVVSTLETGTEVEITDGPVTTDGYAWYEVVTADDDEGWVAGDFLGTEIASGEFAVGDSLVVIDGPLNVRDAAGTDADVQFQLDTGAEVEITDGPISADDYTWYEISTSDDKSGWVAGEFLGTESGDTGDTVEFSAGDAVVVTDGPLNIRDDSSTDGDVLTQLETGERATILDGPVAADGYSWYQVETDDGTTGWVAGEFLGFADDDTNTPGTADFAVGDAVTATVDGMNLRSAAGLDAEVIDQVDEGALFLVQDGPVSADGYTWYQVFNYYYGEGWVAGELMALEPDGFPGEDGT